jgi:hypothetical protein
MEHEAHRLTVRAGKWLAGTVALLMLLAVAFSAGSALAGQQNLRSVKYDDLGGEPARFAFVCKEQNAFYRALGTLERTMDFGPVKKLFANQTCVLLRGMPAKPEKLAGDPYMHHVLTTDDAEGTTVRVYDIERDGKTAWVAVWFSDGYGEGS